MQRAELQFRSIRLAVSRIAAPDWQYALHVSRRANPLVLESSSINVAASFPARLSCTVQERRRALPRDRSAAPGSAFPVSYFPFVLDLQLLFFVSTRKGKKEATIRSNELVRESSSRSILYRSDFEVQK